MTSKSPKLTADHLKLIVEAASQLKRTTILFMSDDIEVLELADEYRNHEVKLIKFKISGEEQTVNFAGHDLIIALPLSKHLVTALRLPGSPN